MPNKYFKIVVDNVGLIRYTIDKLVHTTQPKETMYQIKQAPQPPALSKRREALAVILECAEFDALERFNNVTSLKQAGTPDKAFYNFLSTIK